MFIVLSLKKELNISIMGLNTPVKMDFADGMIGVIPVFETREDAERFAGENVDIVEVAEKNI